MNKCFHKEQLIADLPFVFYHLYFKNLNPGNLCNLDFSIENDIDCTIENFRENF